MLRGYRGIIIAAAGWLILAASPGGDTANPKAEKTQQEVAKSLDRIAAALDEANKPKREAADCPEGGKDRKSNLCAQWKAADAAKQAADASDRTVTVGWIGIALGAITMGAAIAAATFAKKAADHTETGANATIAGNNQTRVSAERQDRAYIAVQPGGINKTQNGTCAVGDVIIKNVGNIPAHNVSTHARIKVGKSKKIKKFDSTDPWNMTERTIHPGDNIRRSSTGNLDIKNIDIAGVYVFVWGVVHYSDGFGNKRFTRFCHRYPGACVQHNDIQSMNGPGGMAAIVRQTRYPDELIPAKYARHHQYGNDAD
jgi:hypothetical protein